MKKIAFIGAGHIHTPGFIKRVNERDNIATKLIWDHDAERAARRATELNAEVTSDLSAIWSDDEIEGVIICAETNLHQDLVMAAADAKKHMFVEKPLGIGKADAYAMAKAIDDAGVLFQTGYFMRGNPIHRFLKDHIAKGSFGKITRFRHTNLHSGSLGGWFDTEWRWMADLEQAGVGGFGDLGTHSLDIMLWLMGDVDSVIADIRVVTGRYDDCDETGESIIKFSNGVIGTLAAGWVDVMHPANIVLSGTEGLAYVNNKQLFVKSEHIDGADGETPFTDLPEEWPHAFDLFLNALSGEENVPLVTPQEAAYRSSVMEAMYQSNTDGAWVSPTKG